MTEKSEKHEGKITEFTIRHSEWRNIAINQLSMTNNVLLTLSSGIFMFSLDKHRCIFKAITFSPHRIDLGYTAYMASTFSLTLSIMFGIFVLFSRLYDFRISRQIVLVRKRAYLEGKPLDDNHPWNVTRGDRWRALWRVMFCKLDFVDQKKPWTEQKTVKFHELRRLADTLGGASWVWTKVQVLAFFVAILLYLAFLFLE